MAGSNDVAISVVKDCLQQVFGEADASKRKEAITRLWVEDEGSVFADPERVWRGHKAIDDCVAELADKFVGWTFVALGPAIVLPEKPDEEGLCVVKLSWGYGPPEEKPQVLGENVATLVNGKIKFLYAILESDAPK